MSKQSRRFLAMKKQLTLLRRDLLPLRMNPTGSYQRGVFTKTMAYRVLAHAEFESYLEERVKEVSLCAIRSFQNKQKLSKTVICLLAFSGLELKKPPKTHKPKESNRLLAWEEEIKLSKKLIKSSNVLISDIGSNHGIKEENVLRMLLPIGVDVDQIDELWLSSLNSFGADRGRTAHLSSAQQRPDPSSELKKVDYLLEGFEKVDVLINQLLRKCR